MIGRRRVVQRPAGLLRRLVRWPLAHPMAAVFVLAALTLIAERGL